MARRLQAFLKRTAEMVKIRHSSPTPQDRQTATGWLAIGLLMVAVTAAGGCVSLSTGNLGTQVSELTEHPNLAPILDGTQVDEHGIISDEPVPTLTSPPSELAKVSLPRYPMAPPDILVIQAVRLFPKSPYYLQTSDFLQIVVPNSLIDQPIASTFQVDSAGMVNLGPAYDSVKVAGLTLDEAHEAVAKHLSRLIDQPQVSIALLQASGLQQVAGEHLIGPDGHINLGVYGSVYVSGLTVDEARVAIEEQLARYLDQPKVSVEVLIYNSKFFYVITEGAGFGDNIVRIPVTGNETVLDAIAQIGGLQQISSKRIWISRPAPKNSGCDQILPVDWQAITKGASTGTNYQLLPGDRIFIAEDRMIALGSFVNKMINPVERVFGFSLLGAQTIQFMQRFPKGLFF